LRPHLVQRGDRRSMSLDESDPQQMINGTSVTSVRCRHRSQTTQHHGVPWRSCSSVGRGRSMPASLTPIRASGTVARFGGETCRQRLHLERAVSPAGRGPCFRIGSICARHDRASFTIRNWTSCAIGVIAYSDILRDGPKKQNVPIKWENGHGQSYHCRFRAVAGFGSTGHASSGASDGQHGRDRPCKMRRGFPARRWTLRAQHSCAPIPARCPSV